MEHKNSGITIVELLISISISSVVIMLLMSLLGTTLRAKNEVDYTNRLDSEVYTINTVFNRTIQSMGYRSIIDLSDEYENMFVLLLTEEFEPILEDNRIVINRLDFSPKLLILDLSTEALYFGEVPFQLPTVETKITDLTYQELMILIKEGIDLFIADLPLYRVSNANLIFYEGSSLSHVCFVEDARNLVSPCARGMIKFNFIISYRLPSGGILPSKTYISSLSY